MIKNIQSLMDKSKNFANVILEKTGVTRLIHGVTKYDYSQIRQAIVNNKELNEMKLELYLEDKKEIFSITFGDELVFKTLALAINDQLDNNTKIYDFDFYQSVLEQAKIEYKNIEMNLKNKNDEETKKGKEFAGEVIKNIVKSKDFSVKGATKGITKAAQKTASNLIYSIPVFSSTNLSFNSIFFIILNLLFI